MARQLFKLLVHRLYSASGKLKNDGFTLIELLVGMIVAGFVVSGLLSLTVQLLETNQKESTQTETQQDMQLALNYISEDLREAVYVYSGECLSGRLDDSSTKTNNEYCPGIVNHIRQIPNNSVPILAFWKLDLLPKSLLDDCRDNTAAASVPCVAGRTYTLIVYFLRKNYSSDNPKWAGKARITRYELTQYKSDGNSIANYVNPDQSGVNFRIWPYRDNGTTLTSLQPALPTNDPADTLVDFVDDTARVGDSDVSDAQNRCFNSDNSYKVTPNNTSTPFGEDVRSFYACVREDAGFNQDVFVFLRGNASGRAGISNEAFLPTLQTQVLRRGIIDKEPKPL